jgi:hypothetical protein
MLWITLVVAAGFFLMTLILAATGNLTSGWYLIGAAVYGGVFVMAIIGFIAERAPQAAPSPVYVQGGQVAAAPAATAVPQERARVHQERVIYTTRRGQVVETLDRDPHGVHRDFTIEDDGNTTTVDAVGEAIDARGWRAGRDPEEEELRRGLQRWGRIREVPLNGDPT